VELKGNITPISWQERLESLATIRVGWDNPNEKPPTPEALNNAFEFLNFIDISQVIPIPAIFPETENTIGGVRMEWMTERKQIVLAIYNDNTFFIGCLNRDTNEFIQGTGEDFNSNKGYAFETISKYFLV